MGSCRPPAPNAGGFKERIFVQSLARPRASAVEPARISRPASGAAVGGGARLGAGASGAHGDLSPHLPHGDTVVGEDEIRDPRGALGAEPRSVEYAVMADGGLQAVGLAARRR